MNITRFLSRRVAACALVSLFSIIPSLKAADVSVAKPDASAPVTVTDAGNTWTMDNGIVKATINKRTGDLVHLYYKGMDTMGQNQGRAGGYWEQDPSAAAKVGGLTQSITIDPSKNGG